MTYQVTLDSRNVLLPLTLEDPEGRRIDAPPSRLDMATAMVVSVSAGGGFAQEMFPLRIVSGSAEGYAGKDWELRAQPAGRDHQVFYLGVPDAWFSPAGPHGELKSLSVLVVGTSPMTGREEYSGGVDVTLRAQVPLPLVPGFLSLGERFFPTLLPHNFVAAYALDVFARGGRRDLILLASLQADPSAASPAREAGASRLPVSFGKHWDPKNWVGAVVENLAPAEGSYHLIRGGCFYGRNRKVTHWFGSGIGLEEPGFRQAAAERIRSLGPSGNGAWVFWLEAQGKGAPRPEVLAGLHLSRPQARFSIRHPVLHRVLRHQVPPPETGSGAIPAIARMPAESAVSALAHAARILAGHQDELYRARTEPAHDRWSERAAYATEAGEAPDAGRSAAGRMAEALASAGRGGATAPAEAGGLSSLEADIRDLYRDHGEDLRVLESVFDETGGYAAWDAPGNPVRDLLSAYLGEGAEARAQA